jgi:hypothetical protein
LPGTSNSRSGGNRLDPGRADALITGDGDFSEAHALICAPIMNVLEFAERFAPELIAA